MEAVALDDVAAPLKVERGVTGPGLIESKHRADAAGGGRGAAAWSDSSRAGRQDACRAGLWPGDAHLCRCGRGTIEGVGGWAWGPRPAQPSGPTQAG